MLPGGTLARLRLWCCTKNTQEMPAGTLRKVGGSVPFCIAWMRCLDAVPNVKNLDSHHDPLYDAVDLRRQEAGKAGVSSAIWLPRLSFLPPGSVCEADLGYLRLWGFVFGILCEHHRVGQTAQRGRDLETTRVGSWGCQGLLPRTKRRHHPKARTNGMNGL